MNSEEKDTAKEEAEPVEAIDEAADDGGDTLAARARRAFGFGREDDKEAEATVEGEPTERDIAELLRSEESARTEAAENYDKYLRAVAELENFKKRAARERADLLRYAGEHLAGDLLEVVDNLERALALDVETNPAEFRKGIELIYERFLSLLDKHSIKPSDAAGQQFDPTQHEALAIVPTADHPPNTVMEQFRKAYFFKDKLLRPAQVVVSAAPAGAEENAGEPLEAESAPEDGGEQPA